MYCLRDAQLFAAFHIPFDWTAINNVKRASLAVALNALNVVLCERGRRVAVDGPLRKQLQAAFHLAFRVYRFAEESHPELEAQVTTSLIQVVLILRAHGIGLFLFTMLQGPPFFWNALAGEAAGRRHYF
jgi:hypothetical protein